MTTATKPQLWSKDWQQLTTYKNIGALLSNSKEIILCMLGAVLECKHLSLCHSLDFEHWRRVENSGVRFMALDRNTSGRLRSAQCDGVSTMKRPFCLCKRRHRLAHRRTRSLLRSSSCWFSGGISSHPSASCGKRRTHGGPLLPSENSRFAHAVPHGGWKIPTYIFPESMSAPAETYT